MVRLLNAIGGAIFVICMYIFMIIMTPICAFIVGVKAFSNTLVDGYATLFRPISDEEYERISNEVEGRENNGKKID